MISPSLRSMGILGVFLVANTCQAGTVTALLGTPVNHNNTDNVSINEGNPSSAFSTYTFSGAIPWTQQSPINPAIGHPTFYTFCIELTQNVTIGGTYTYQLTALQSAPIPGSSQTQGNPPAVGMGSIRADAISRLWNGAYGTSAVNGNTTADLLKGAAFQLALWRVEYDMNSVAQVSKDFTTGNFRASSSVTGLMTQAMAFLDGVNAATGNYSESALLASGLHLTALTSDTLQDQVTATPEPSSICIAVVGSLLFGGLAFKRRKKPALAQI